MKVKLIPVDEWNELFDTDPNFGIGNMDDFIKEVQDNALNSKVVTAEMLKFAKHDNLYRFASNLNAMLTHGFCEKCGKITEACRREGCTPQLYALQIATTTMVGVHGSHPFVRGNCFTVIADDLKEYKIVNFVFENMKHLLSIRLLKWPIKITPLSNKVAIISDERVPSNLWYLDRYCEICCPASLLPTRQKEDIRNKDQQMITIKSDIR